MIRNKKPNSKRTALHFAFLKMSDSPFGRPRYVEIFRGDIKKESDNNLYCNSIAYSFRCFSLQFSLISVIEKKDEPIFPLKNLL